MRLQSNWVGKEVRHALEVQKQRGKERFPVIPLSLDGTKLGVLGRVLRREPLYIAVSSVAGGVDRPCIRYSSRWESGNRGDVSPRPQPNAEPLEELVLELTDLKFDEQDGVRRASARARAVYEPGTPGQREVNSEQSWRFVARIGPIEAEELRWYLEKFAIWPSEYFRDRARKVEENLVRVGTASLRRRTARRVHGERHERVGPDRGAGRPPFFRSSRCALEAGARAGDVEAAREAATLLLGLPWELLHDGNGFLFQGAKPTRVRRRLPNTRVLDVPWSPRPSASCSSPPARRTKPAATSIIAASALPLVEAMEELGGLVRIHVLSPPTLPGLA